MVLRQASGECVAGHDDAIALMVACSHPEIDLLGVSTVACNQTVEKTTINAISVLHACGYGDVRVAQGAPKPLMRQHVHCAEIHGDSGLDATGGGRLFPLVDTSSRLPRAAIAIADAIKQVHQEGRGPLQLVCTGALTNAALAFMLYPELVDPSYVEVTLMGGAIGIGNTGPVQVGLQFPPPPFACCTRSRIPCAKALTLLRWCRSLTFKRIQRQLMLCLRVGCLWPWSPSRCATPFHPPRFDVTHEELCNMSHVTWLMTYISSERPEADLFMLLFKF